MVERTSDEKFSKSSEKRKEERTTGTREFGSGSRH